jgi:hypothetical protein
MDGFTGTGALKVAKKILVEADAIEDKNPRWVD